MTTIAGHDAALAAQLVPVLARYDLQDEIGLLADLVVFMSGYAARQVEKRARPDDRWAPKQRERRTA